MYNLAQPLKPQEKLCADGYAMQSLYKLPKDVSARGSEDWTFLKGTQVDKTKGQLLVKEAFKNQGLPS